MGKFVKGNTFWDHENNRKTRFKKGKKFNGVINSKSFFKKGNKEGLEFRFKKQKDSYSPYSVDWTQTLRISIRERDKYTCICGKKQSDKTFSVHHIDYDKKNCNPKNLITLCNACHSKTNHNREYWINYFNYRSVELE